LRDVLTWPMKRGSCPRVWSSRRAPDRACHGCSTTVASRSRPCRSPSGSAVSETRRYSSSQHAMCTCLLGARSVWSILSLKSQSVCELAFVRLHLHQKTIYSGLSKSNFKDHHGNAVITQCDIRRRVTKAVAYFWEARLQFYRKQWMGDVWN